MDFKILWTSNLMSFFKYGSTVSYVSKEEVQFENVLLSPGAEIVSWHSEVDYFTSRTPLQLPLLKRDHRYYLRLSGAVFPEGSLLIKVAFFNRVSEPVGHCFFGGQGGSFIYPKDAYAYKVSLLSQGLKRLQFHALELSEEV